MAKSVLNEIQQLGFEALKAKHPNVPEYALPKPKKVDTSKANGLTGTIIQHLKLHGHYGVRINTQGQWDDKLKKMRTGSTRKGTADIHACIKGVHCSIEIKIGKDRQSPEQKATEEDVRKAGGKYVIVKTIDDYLNWYRYEFERN